MQSGNIVKLIGRVNTDKKCITSELSLYEDIEFCMSGYCKYESEANFGFYRCVQLSQEKILKRIGKDPIWHFCIDELVPVKQALSTNGSGIECAMDYCAVAMGISGT